MKIIPLSEGSFTIDATKQFIPFDKETDQLIERNRGSLLVEIQPFAIITDQDVIVLDTGLGFCDATGTPIIHRNLQKAGIAPHQVTKVLLSHLHRDHAGGISYIDERTQERWISFPYATYYCQRREFDLAISNSSASYQPDLVGLLEEYSRVVWLQDDAGSIDNYIHYTVTAGHSQFHQVFSIQQNVEILFFGGDEAPQLQQLKNKFIAKYDRDGRRAMEWRKKWWEESAVDHRTFLFYHDIQTPLYQR
ncbi:MAG: MBL fold metallo-hydrolase [Sediminibacterium sp.]|nr:MBL fold metallo-hydrolase [Sediminibacterium sp.]